MKLIGVGIGIILLAIIGGIFWWQVSISPANSEDHTEKPFTVQKGEGVKQIGKDLESQGLIKNSFAFYLIVKQLGMQNAIQAGSFKLSPSLSDAEIAKKLTQGTEDIWVTIPEGKRADEIAGLLMKAGFSQYSESWRTALQPQEGYLFPDTYSFSKDSSIDQIITTMKTTFTKKYTSIPPNPATPYSEAQLVTIASMVEREAKFPEDQPLVASVIENRLALTMPLQIDATIQYALGQQPDGSWWKKDLTIDDLKIVSPYNSYTNPGLPPTPIANPGIGALQAAIHPANTQYLYYISDSSGHNHYAKTVAEHNANIKKYGLQ